MPLCDSPIPLKAGQRVAIDGVIVPLRQQFVWDKTRIHILEENVELKAEPVSDLGKNAQELQGHLVSVEGLIDSKQDNPTHYIINFLSGSTLARANVLKGTNSSPLHFKEGDFVRMKCVYSPQFDRDGNLSDSAIVVNSPADVQVIGSLKTDARFTKPITLSENIAGLARRRHRGSGEGRRAQLRTGQMVTLWDATGQIMVQSKQSQPLRFGDRVEAIGYPDLKGVETCLLNGLYRLAAPTNTIASALMITNTLPLRLAEQIRDLSPEEAGRHLPVNLRAVVAWLHSSTPFIYVLDASGGIQVVNPKLEETNAVEPGMIVTLKGVTSEGALCPWSPTPSCAGQDGGT